MIKNALYKQNKNSKDNIYGWDFIKVVDTKVSRTIHWTPTSDKNDKDYEYFWNRLPQGDVHKIVHTEYDVILYGYDKGKKNKDIFRVAEDEFWDVMIHCYELVSIEGAE
jgi:hypothetical protein